MTPPPLGEATSNSRSLSAGRYRWSRKAANWLRCSSPYILQPRRGALQRCPVLLHFYLWYIFRDYSRLHSCFFRPITSYTQSQNRKSVSDKRLCKALIQSETMCRFRVGISSALISYIIFLALQIHYNCYFYINRTQGMALYEMQRLLWEKSKAYKMWIVGLDNHTVLWYTVFMRLNKRLYRAVNPVAGFSCHGSSRPNKHGNFDTMVSETTVLFLFA